MCKVVTETFYSSKVDLLVSYNGLSPFLFNQNYSLSPHSPYSKEPARKKGKSECVCTATIF